MKRIKTYHFNLLFLFLLGFIAACGNSGSDSEPVTGSIFAGPINAASVIVKNTSGATIAGPVSTALDGTYTVTIPVSYLLEDLVFEATGGTFTDEATTFPTTAGILSAHISGGTLSAGGSVHVTPATTIIQKLVAGGKTKTEAETAFTTTFGYTPDTSIAPTDATNPSDSATDEQKLTGLRAAAFSQLTNDLGLDPAQQFGLLTAIASDLSDGSLDGVGASGTVNIVTGKDMPIDIQNRFASALTTFLNSDNNQTGLTADQVGTLPFAMIALTDTYKVEYVPGMMDAMEGKTTFNLKITNLSTGQAVSGLTVSIMPTMHMLSKNHASPADSVVDNGDGTYSCTIHYLMASTMNGTSMGYWELAVMIGGMGETAYFYPSVMMSMSGDTVKATLKGQSDKITSMSMTSNRSYYCFNDGVTYGMSGSTFKLFVATMESMMSFPAVYTGVSLNDENGASWSISSMSVEASTDTSTWVAATGTGNGYWTVTGLTGLTSGTAGTVYVRVTVNGEQKTTDGNAVSGSNGYATFTVMPASSMGM